MLGSKFTRQDIRSAAHKVGTKYMQAREALGHLDKGVQTVKRIHSNVGPFLNFTREGRILNDNLTKAT